MKRSRNEDEAVAVACSLSYVQKRSDDDIVSFVADLRALKGQDTLLLSDSLVLSRKALSLGVPLVEQSWQRLMPRADAETSPAARRLADDAQRVASRLPLSGVRPVVIAAGGAERCQIEDLGNGKKYANVFAVATFVDPATGELRLARDLAEEVRIYDPIAGGVAVAAIDMGSNVYALAVFTDPATGAPRLACGCCHGKVRIVDPVAAGEVLLVIDVGSSQVPALALFEDKTGALRLACASGKMVYIFDPVAGGEVLLVLDVGSSHVFNQLRRGTLKAFVGTKALTVFVDPVSGEPRLACASGDVLVFDPVAGGEALLVLDTDSPVNALAVVKEPTTGAPRLACGSSDGKVRVFDAISGGNALLVLDAGDWAYALVIFKDLSTGALRLASGSRDTKVRVFDPLAGGEALVVLEGHINEVRALTAFDDPATGEPRLVSGSEESIRVWNPVAGAAQPERHSKKVNALVTFVDPVTGVLRVATGSDDGTIRVWDAETGRLLLVIDAGSEVKALAFFKDLATGAPRLACSTVESDEDYNVVCADVRVFDPVAGCEALLVIDVGEEVNVLAFFADPATGAPRLACGNWEKAFVVDPVAGGESLLVIVRSDVRALAVFQEPAVGEARLACGCGYRDGQVLVFDPVVGGEALVVIDVGPRVNALTVFEDPATGDLRLASGSNDGSVRVWDLAAGGAALFVFEGHTHWVEALTAFVDPATGEMRLASGSVDNTLRVWDASKGGAELRVVVFDDDVSALAVTSDMSRLFVASGKSWGELRVGSS